MKILSYLVQQLLQVSLAVIKPNRAVKKKTTTRTYPRPDFLVLRDALLQSAHGPRNCHKARGQGQDGIVIGADLFYFRVRTPLVVQLDCLSELELSIMDVIGSQTDPMFSVPFVCQRLVRSQATAAGVQNRRLVRTAGGIRTPAQRVQFRVQERIVMRHVRILIEPSRKQLSATNEIRSSLDFTHDARDASWTYSCQCQGSDLGGKFLCHAQVLSVSCLPIQRDH